MKTLALVGIGIVLSSAVAMGQAVDPNILRFGLGKTRGYVQSGNGGPPAPSSFTFDVFIEKKDGGAVNGAKVEGGGYLDQHGPQNLNPHGNGAQFRSTTFVDQGSLDTAFPNDNSGNYRLKIDTGEAGGELGEGFDYDIPLPLDGDQYVPDIPTLALDNGSWQDGKFKVNPGHAMQFAWNFGSFNPDTDFVKFAIETIDGVPVFEESFVGTNPNGKSIGPDFLNPGQAYRGRLIFGRGVHNADDVPGARGASFYAHETIFNFEAVPEPSTYALIAVGLGAVALPLIRQRRSQR